MWNVFKQAIRIFTILCATASLAYSQLTDDFSDGNFTSNPAWNGDVAVFTVNGTNQLQLYNNTASGSYLSSSLAMNQLDNSEWNMRVRQAFAPSSSNFGRIYLVSNQQNLKGSLNGYFLQLGESGSADAVELFVQTGTGKTSVCRGTNGYIATAFNIDIRVTRNGSGLWSLYVKSVTDANFSSAQATGTNTLHSSALYFGVYAEYTVSNARNFYWDNITVTSPPDVVSPAVVTVTAISNHSVEITFSENLSVATANLSSNYQTDLGTPTSVNLSGNIVTLTFTGSFVANQLYLLTINGISDMAGNIIDANTTTSFTWYQAVQTTATSPIINYKDIVINELMADPNPPIGLPNVEYMELYNQTNRSISLQNFVLTDGVINRPFVNPVTIAGSSYLIICSSGTNKALLESVVPGIQVYTLSGFGLTDTGEQETLKDATGKIIDQVSYKNSWYKDTGKSSGGYSLEMINPTLFCQGQKNWTANNSETGGSPGSQNSVYELNIATINPTITETKVVSLSEIKIAFSATMDSVSLKTGVYSISGGLVVQSASAVYPTYDTVRIQLSSSLETGKSYTISIDNVKDCQGNILVQNIATFSKGRAPNMNEVVINEFFPDPSPQIGLPEYEFIELFNTTNETLDLSDFILKDATLASNGKLPSGTSIEPNGFLILCPTNYVDDFSSYGKTVGVTGFPSLNNSNETIALYNDTGTLINSLFYTDKWYRDEDKKEGGWSLERINPYKECGEASNWTASSNANGGTPGFQNSVFSIQKDGNLPTVTGLVILNNSIIGIAFSEALDTINLHENTFTLSNSIGIQHVMVAPINADTVFLTLSPPLDSGKIYTIQIQNLYDCSGNKTEYTSRNFGLGKKPKPFEIVINEIMSDETPSIGMPEAEFVELFNTTDKLMDLTGFKLTDGSSTGKFPTGAVMPPNGYLILCTTSHTADFKPYGDTYGLTSFPSLSASGETITLNDANGTTISTVKYADSWYKDAVKKDGGWSLERVDPLNPCGTSNNWAASINPKGGTPGKQNSVYAQNPDNTGPKLIKAFAISQDTLLLSFDEPVDSVSALLSTININNNISIVSRLVYSDYLKLVATPTFTGKTNYTASVSNIRDCVGNYMGNNNSATFYLAEQSDSSDIVLNEILFNPKPGGNDFVEVYNKSDKYINLKNWQLATVDAKTGLYTNYSTITTDNHLLRPKEYRVFTLNKASIENFYPRAIDSNFVEMSKFPTYNDDEGTTAIFNNRNRLIDRFDYKDNYHFKLIDNTEGVSLERISFDLPTNTPENWVSAAATAGYATPGYQNSQSQQIDLTSEKAVKIEPEVFTPDEDGFRDFTTISFNISGTGKSGSISVFDSEGRMVRKLAQNQLLGNTVFYQWNGLDDNNHKVRTGYYMVYVEVLDLNGNTSAYKQAVVVGAKF